MAVAANDEDTLARRSAQLVDIRAGFARQRNLGWRWRDARADIQRRLPTTARLPVIIIEVLVGADGKGILRRSGGRQTSVAAGGVLAEVNPAAHNAPLHAADVISDVPAGRHFGDRQRHVIERVAE